jgi:hypothetical protein
VVVEDLGEVVQDQVFEEGSVRDSYLEVSQA